MFGRVGDYGAGELGDPGGQCTRMGRYPGDGSALATAGSDPGQCTRMGRFLQQMAWSVPEQSEQSRAPEQSPPEIVECPRAVVSPENVECPRQLFPGNCLAAVGDYGAGSMLAVKGRKRVPKRSAREASSEGRLEREHGGWNLRGVLLRARIAASTPKTGPCLAGKCS